MAGRFFALWHMQLPMDLYLPSRRFTVPIIWDKKHDTIVNNESSEIIRILNTAFNDLIPEDKAQLDLYPEPLRAEIDEINDWVYDNINSKSPLCRAFDLAN